MLIAVFKSLVRQRGVLEFVAKPSLIRLADLYTLERNGEPRQFCFQPSLSPETCRAG